MNEDVDKKLSELIKHALINIDEYRYIMARLTGNNVDFDGELVEKVIKEIPRKLFLQKEITERFMELYE